MDCQEDNGKYSIKVLFEDPLFELEQSACVHSSYPPLPPRILRSVQKVDRMCYIRITEILRSERAEQMCRDHGYEPAIIDNIQLLEKLKELNMCKNAIQGIEPFS